MNKKTFIETIRTMADKLEAGEWEMIHLESGYIFGNRNYGEVNIEVAKGVRISVNLYEADEEEKGEKEE